MFCLSHDDDEDEDDNVWSEFGALFSFPSLVLGVLAVDCGKGRNYYVKQINAHLLGQPPRQYLPKIAHSSLRSEVSVEF